MMFIIMVKGEASASPFAFGQKSGPASADDVICLTRKAPLVKSVAMSRCNFLKYSA
jgi:hypothetical protein